MAMTMEQMTDAFKTLMQQQATLNEMISDLVKVQAQAITSQGGGGGVKGKPWHDLELYRNVKLFAGEQKEWEEYNCKLRGQIAAHNAVAAEVLDYVESTMSEGELEQDIVMVEVAGEEVDLDTLQDINKQIYNILLNLTTAEANAVVRRCKGRNGLLAWKRLCTRPTLTTTKCLDRNH